MKINEFLDLVRNCSDDRLYESFCIGNNWIILVGLERLSIRKLLLENLKFIVHTKENSERGGLISELKGRGEDASFLEQGLESEFKYSPEQQPRLEYVSGTVVILPHRGAEGYSLTRYGFDLTDEERRHASYQRKNYKSSLSLHSCQLRKIPGISDNRAIAIVTEEISLFLMEKQVPFCLPHSLANTKDYSRIVYFPDSVEEEMCRK